MSQATAQASAQRLKAIMEKWVVRCSIELQVGRGGGWDVAKYIRFWHHTVSRYVPGGNMTPVLFICKNGRPNDGLPGPLCNGYIGYDLVFRIICLELANHSGLGGPMTIDGVHVPLNSGRGPTFGIEVEGGIQDWENIPGMLETMGRADNALAEWMGRPLTSQCEHSTWTTRKIDRLKFTRARGIALTNQYANIQPPPPEKRKDPTVLRLLVGHERPNDVCLTDELGSRKRPMRSREEAGAFLWEIRAAGGIVVTQQDGVSPVIWAQSDVDAIPTFNSKEAQLVDFVQAPDGNGTFLVLASSVKLRMSGDVLAGHQNLWRSRGYNTDVQFWNSADIDAVPEVTTAPPS